MGNLTSSNVKVGTTVYLDTQVYELKGESTLAGKLFGWKGSPDKIDNHMMNTVKSGLRQKGYNSWADVYK